MDLDHKNQNLITLLQLIIIIMYNDRILENENKGKS